jgi:hypothetical protein
MSILPRQRSQPCAAFEIQPFQRVCVYAEAAQYVGGFLIAVVEVCVVRCAAEGDSSVFGDHGR